MDPHVITRYIKDLLVIRDTFFSDLGFASERQTSALSLSMRGQPARYLRFRLSAEGILDLPSVTVVAGVGPQQAGAPEASLTASSLTVPELVTGQQLSSTSRSYSFHITTAKQAAPWMILDLGSTCALHSVKIGNRADKRAVNSYYLVIDHSADGVRWQTIYDHSRRHSQFTDFLAGRRVGFSGTQRELETHELVHDVVTLISVRDFSGAVKTLNARPGVSWETKMHIVTALNEAVLPHYGVEWGSHGIGKTFRFWTDAEKIRYLEFADELIGVFREQLGIDACMGYGSVLSVVRDRQLMPHDDDLDLIIAFPEGRCHTFEEAREQAIRLLREQDYHPSAEFASHFKVRREGTEPMDVFVGIEEGEFLVWHPGPRRQILRSDVFPPTQLSLLGVRCLVPRNPTAYLEKVYGPEWVVPKPRWTHTWDRSEMEDLLATRDESSGAKRLADQGVA